MFLQDYVKNKKHHRKGGLSYEKRIHDVLYFGFLVISQH